MKKILVALAATLLLAGNAFATVVTISGDTSAPDGSWDRPIGSGPSISGLGPVNFDVQSFFTDTDGLYDLSSIQGYDGYIHIYEGVFDPLDQLTGLIGGDDDGDTGIGSSDIDGLILMANVQYFFVTSGFGFDDFGAYDNTIESLGFDANIVLGDLAPVGAPEPAIVLLMGLGLFGIALARRRS